MIVKMHRTIETHTGDHYDAGRCYELPDALAAAWCLYNICSEAQVAEDVDESDAADHDAVTEEDE